VAEKTPLPVEPLGLRLEKRQPVDEAVAVQAQVIARLVTLLKKPRPSPVAMAAPPKLVSVAPISPGSAAETARKFSGVLEAQSKPFAVGIFAPHASPETSQRRTTSQ